MTTKNIVVYNDTLRALKSLESGLIMFNNRLTEFNKRELEDYINRLDRNKAEFEIYYTGPQIIKLQLLKRVHNLRDKAIISIQEFDQVSTNHLK